MANTLTDALTAAARFIQIPGLTITRVGGTTFDRDSLVTYLEMAAYTRTSDDVSKTTAPVPASADAIAVNEVSQADSPAKRLVQHMLCEGLSAIVTTVNGENYAVELLRPDHVSQQVDAIDAQCFRFFVAALAADGAGISLTPAQKLLKASMSNTESVTLESVRKRCIAAIASEARS